MSSNTFTVVGITVHDGNAKVRFANDLTRRVKQFIKGGATRCDFIELPNPMNKNEALEYMLSHSDFQSASDQATINDCIDSKRGTSKRGEFNTEASPSLDAIRSRGKKSAESTTVEDVLEAVS